TSCDPPCAWALLATRTTASSPITVSPHRVCACMSDSFLLPSSCGLAPVARRHARRGPHACQGWGDAQRRDICRGSSSWDASKSLSYLARQALVPAGSAVLSGGPVAPGLQIGALVGAALWERWTTARRGKG